MNSTEQQNTSQPEDQIAVTGVRFRSGIAALPGYIAGRPSNPGARKASSNENPYGPLPGVLEKITAAAAEVNLYPDPGCEALREAVANQLGVSGQSLLFSTGSLSALQHVITATAGEGDEIIYAWRSFEAYPIVTGLVGAVAVPIALTDSHEHDFEAMAAAINERTRLIIVCSPNNPTGAVVKDQQFDAFMAKVPSDVLVMLDEAYVEFIVDPDAVKGLDVFARYPNVALLRTFSKAYGLAGLRVGYAVVRPELAVHVSKAVTTFGVNSLAQVAAVASLEPDVNKELMQRVALLQIERARVIYALADQGWSFPQSEGNFVYLPLGDKSRDFADHCDRGGLVVRAYANDGVRITIGDSNVNDLIISLCKEWRAFSKAARLI